MAFLDLSFIIYRVEIIRLALQALVEVEENAVFKASHRTSSPIIVGVE